MLSRSTFAVGLPLLLVIFQACVVQDERDGSQEPGGASPSTTPEGQPKGEPGQSGPGTSDGVKPSVVAGTIEFTGISAPSTPEEKRLVRSTPTVTLNGKVLPTGYNTFLRGGDVLGDATFGAMIDVKGNPVRLEDGSLLVDTYADFTSLLPVGTKLFSLTHFEGARPSGMYLTELVQDSSMGMLKAKSTRPVDFSSIGGLYNPCAGSVTPWNTHLGSEEYEPDARAFFEAPQTDKIDAYFLPMTRYFGVDPKKATLAQVREVLNPYRYGFPVEVSVSESGETTVAKHYAMGRRAMELAYVMPDQKTVYMTDDGENTGFYMYVADKAGELARGKIYAMKWKQTSDENGGAAEAVWIPLGPSASDDDVRALVDRKVTFTDIFETQAPAADGTCAADFRSVRSSRTPECLKLKPGMLTAAVHLETRRYAAYVGATTELNKEEGFTFDPDSMTAFVGISDIDKAMLDNGPNDKGGPNHVRLPKNICGAVYALSVGKEPLIGSDYVVQGWKALVAGTPSSTEGTCEIENIANPDNVTFLRGYRTLVIGEDCGKAQHQNDAMWTYNLDTKKLTRILTTPYGAETTSPYFYPNLRGFAYIMGVVQHPYNESDQSEVEKESDPARAKMPYVGFFGPFPRMN